MAGVATEGDYLEQLQRLLPEGRAWPRDPDAIVTRALGAVAADLARLDAHAVGLVGDVRPDVPGRHLPDWERVMGLPDACSPTLGSLAARVGRVVNRVSALPFGSPDRYTAIAASLGYDAEVIEHDQTAAEALGGVDTSGGRWRYVWWLRVDTDSRIRYFDTLSTAADALRSSQSDAELECRVEAAAPAHTHPVITWLARSLTIVGNDQTTRNSAVYLIDPRDAGQTLQVALAENLPFRGGSAVHRGRILFRRNNGELMRLDFGTGAMTSIGGAGLGGYHMGLVSHQDELLCLIRGRQESGSRLIQISPTSGAPTLRAEVSIDFAGGAASDGETVFASTVDELHAVDPISGATRRIGPLGYPIGDCAMCFHRRHLYAARKTGSSTDLFRVDPSSGAAHRTAALSRRPADRVLGALKRRGLISISDSATPGIRNGVSRYTGAPSGGAGAPGGGGGGFRPGAGGRGGAGSTANHRLGTIAIHVAQITGLTPGAHLDFSIGVSGGAGAVGGNGEDGRGAHGTPPGTPGAAGSGPAGYAIILPN